MSISIKASGGIERSYNITSTTAIWNTIPTKGMQALPEDEIKKELLVLADRAGKAANADPNTMKSEFDIIAARKRTLLTQYLSYVSPDRKAMFEEAKKTLKSGNQKGSEPLGNYTLEYYLRKHEKDDNGEPHYKEQDLPSGTHLSPIGSFMGNGFMLSVNGSDVLSYDSGLLTWWGTPAEIARQTEFVDFYNTAYFSARAAYGNNSQAAPETEVADYLLSHDVTFDVRA